MLTPLDLTKPVSMASFTPEQREAERLEIARLTKEWEKQHGKAEAAKSIKRWQPLPKL